MISLKDKIILMVLNQKFLPDIRVEKEIKVLKNYGYRVIVLASEEGKDNMEYEIVRLKTLTNFSTRIFSQLFFKLNPALKLEILEKLKEKGIHHIDFIHVHDLLWAFLGVYLSKEFKSKLILDFHENYPAAYYQWNIYANKYKKFIKELFINYKKLKQYEIDMVKKSDKTILVVEEAKNRFVNKIPENKFEIVSNTERPEDWDFCELKRPTEKFIISYVGGIGPHRGIDTVLKGMKYLNERYILNVVGINKKDRYYSELKKIKPKSNVNFIEWIPFKEVKNYINNSHVCLVPHNKNEHTETTIPHKIFQYMALKRPVLVSDVTPLKRIVKETNSGMIFEAGNPKDFASKIIEMDNYEKLIKWGENGRKAVEGKYNWENDAKKLINLYKDLEKNG